MTPGVVGWYVGAFILALGVLVIVHEFGHYLAARLCGVKVLRFAFGFGPTLWSRRAGRDGTEWALAAFPLGGYVKMLDEREGAVAPHELARAFNRQSVGRRAFIVVAGPAANLLLAVFLYWTVFLYGVPELMPRLGAAPAQSTAAVAGVPAGGLVRAVNRQPIATWQELRWEVLRRALDGEVVELEIESPQREIGTYRLDVTRFPLQDLEKDPLRPLGLVLFRPRVSAVVGRVAPDSAAAEAGFASDDRILSIDGHAVSEWADVSAATRGAAGRRLQIVVERGGRSLSLAVVPREVEEGGQRIGRLGLLAKGADAPQPDMLIEVRYGPFEAASRAVAQTWDTSILSLRMMGRMITGDLSWKNLSGPVTIADYAGQSARMGLSYYLRFLAVISISLGVLNLLPIPVLDGGHLMYYLIEFIQRGPVSERVMEIGQQIGLALLALLMAFAFYNDIIRLVSG